MIQRRPILGPSTCLQCRLAQQPGTVLLALAGSSALAPTGNSASARCCNSALARWNTVALAQIGNSAEERTGTVGWEQSGTLAFAPGVARSGNSLSAHSGRILSAPSYILVGERWCTLDEAHSSTVALAHCCSLCCILAWGQKTLTKTTSFRDTNNLSNIHYILRSYYLGTEVHCSLGTL